MQAPPSPSGVPGLLQQVARAYPEGELHMNNYAAHKRIEVRDWLAADRRVHVHFTPTSASWLNLVEVWFGIIERRALRRGVSLSVQRLNAKIRTFTNGWNERCHPFVWTETVEEMLTNATVELLQRRTTRRFARAVEPGRSDRRTR